MAELLILGLSLIGIGFLYLRVVQPILVDFKLIPPRGGADVAREVMLSSDVSEALQRRPSAGTDGRTEENTRTDRAPQSVVVISAERKAATIALCTALRSGDATREEARALLAPLGISLSNDVWTAARPTAKEDAPPVAYTPIAGRPYDPREYFQDDPQLQYQPPAA